MVFNTPKGVNPLLLWQNTLVSFNHIYERLKTLNTRKELNARINIRDWIVNILPKDPISPHFVHSHSYLCPRGQCWSDWGWISALARVSTLFAAAKPGSGSQLPANQLANTLPPCQALSLCHGSKCDCQVAGKHTMNISKSLQGIMEVRFANTPLGCVR